MIPVVELNFGHLKNIEHLTYDQKQSFLNEVIQRETEKIVKEHCRLNGHIGRIDLEETVQYVCVFCGATKSVEPTMSWPSEG